MKKIWLDFNQPIPKTFLFARRIFLIIGIAAVITVFFFERQAEKQIAALEWQIQSIAKLTSRTAPSFQAKEGTVVSQDVVKQANQVLYQLNLPWWDLFTTLEESLIPSVSLLSVTPDTRRSIITLKAAAKDADAIIDFMERLNQSRLISEVYLTSQEGLDQENAYPLQFTLQASWRAMQ